MDNPRFVDTRSSSFLGEFLYDQVVHQGHFLRQLNQIIDWERFTRRLLKLYKGGGMVERPPFNPAMVLKMELIAYLYNLTERKVEVYINENLPAKYFVGLAADQSAPDHSTLTVFRERLVKRGRLIVFEEMKKRPFGVTILAILAVLAAVLAGVHTLQSLGILPFVLGPYKVHAISFWSFLMWALMVWIWVWVVQMLWKVEKEAWLFLAGLQPLT
jgi:transposase